MLLRRLVEEMPNHTVVGPLDQPISRLEYDSRRVTPGTVFFALPGAPRDGHDYIAAALEHGATAVIYERPVFKPPRIASVRVQDSRQALARAAEVFYGHPSRQLTVIGVTGGEARSSAAILTRRILRSAGIETGLVGSVVHEFGDRVIPVHGSMPEALDTQRLMAAMVRAGCVACVLEILPQMRLSQNGKGTHCDIGVFVNGTGKVASQARCWNGCNDTQMHPLFVKGALDCVTRSVHDLDDYRTFACGRGADARRAVTYGFDHAALVHVLESHATPTGTNLRLRLPHATVEIKVPILNRDDLRAMLAAISVAILWGVPMANLRRGLKAIGPVPGRLEPIESGQPFRVFVDSARTESAMQTALTTVRGTTEGRLIAVFGGRSDYAVDQRARLGELAARLADYTIVTSDNPRRECPDELAAAVVRGHGAVRQDNCHVQLDRAKAIAEAIGKADAGDTVLIMGKGNESYQEYADTIVPFDDRVHARESLENLGFLTEASPIDR